mmetsp:Transcript_13651/g.54053  ORF Transcript_13651/g.54053 Transcript_13651/m.54053 type:complete len:230 (-) Transcript_13651:1312-2001(-)
MAGAWQQSSETAEISCLRDSDGVIVNCVREGVLDLSQIAILSLSRHDSGNFGIDLLRYPKSSPVHGMAPCQRHLHEMVHHCARLYAHVLRQRLHTHASHPCLVVLNCLLRHCRLCPRRHHWPATRRRRNLHLLARGANEFDEEGPPHGALVAADALDCEELLERLGLHAGQLAEHSVVEDLVGLQPPLLRQSLPVAQQLPEEARVARRRPAQTRKRRHRLRRVEAVHFL